MNSMNPVGMSVLGLLILMSTQACSAKPSEETTDSDGDGYNDAVDCAPDNPSINPGAYENLDDNIDSDCDEDPNNCTPQNDCDRDDVSAAEGDCDDLDPCVGGKNECNCLADANAIGACMFGVGRCVDGKPACVANVPTNEVCDGVDQDCNGVVDDKLPDILTSCSTGAPGLCNEGLTNCVGGMIICEPLFQPSPVEVCDADGLDQNCNDHNDMEDGCKCIDGETQACYDGSPDTEGVGNCHVGQAVCEGGLAFGPCVNQQLPGIELCDGNGLDEDCDGLADLDDVQDCTCIIGTSVDCYTGPDGTLDVGICHHGLATCQNGHDYGPCLNQQLPKSEFCDGDGFDEDCDGKADLLDSDCSCINGTAKPCKTGIPGVCADGTSFCVAGQYSQCFQNNIATTEVCNGEDDDCDGFVDDVDVGTVAATETISCGGGKSPLPLVNSPLAACRLQPVVSITRLPAHVSYTVTVDMTDIANPTGTAECSGNANEILGVRYSLIKLPVMGGVNSSNVPFGGSDLPTCSSFDYNNYSWFPPAGWPAIQLASFSQAVSSTNDGVRFSAAWSNFSPAHLRTWISSTGNPLSYDGLLLRMAFSPSLGLGANCTYQCLAPGNHQVTVAKNGSYLAEPLLGVQYFGDGGSCPVHSDPSQCAASVSDHAYELDTSAPHTSGYSGLQAGSNTVTFYISHTSSNSNSRLGLWACAVAR